MFVVLIFIYRIFNHCTGLCVRKNIIIIKMLITYDTADNGSDDKE